MKTTSLARLALAFLFLLAGTLPLASCRIRANIVTLARTKEGLVKGAPFDGVTPMMASIDCGEELDSYSVTYLEYHHDGELIRVLWGPGPTDPAGRRARIKLHCNGDIEVLNGFAYVNAAPDRSQPQSDSAFAPAASQPSTNRPWVKARRVNAVGVGSTWAVEIDDRANQMRDRAYFIDGHHVEVTSIVDDTLPMQYLDDSGKQTFLWHNDAGTYSNELLYSSNTEADNFVRYVMPFACAWGMPPPYPPCP